MQKWEIVSSDAKMVRRFCVDLLKGLDYGVYMKKLHKIPAQMENNPFFTDAIKAKANAASAASKANFGQAVEAGVNIAFGTDTGVTQHGKNAEEFALMVENGMSEMAAIHAATVAAADLIEMSAELGTIEAGKIADIIAVDGNPLDDITELERVTVVIKEGVRHK